MYIKLPFHNFKIISILAERLVLNQSQSMPTRAKRLDQTGHVNTYYTGHCITVGLGNYVRYNIYWV